MRLRLSASSRHLNGEDRTDEYSFKEQCSPFANRHVVVRTLERILNFTCIYVLSFPSSIRNVPTNSVCGKEAPISTK